MPRIVTVENNLPVSVDALFQEESTKLEQSRLFHLIEIELANGSTTGSVGAGSDQLTVLNASEISAGQYITITGVGERRALEVNQDTSVITLDSAAGATVTNAVVTYKKILNVADSNYDIQYDTTVYMRFPVKVSELSISSDGSIDKAKLSVANVSREIMFYVQQFKGLRNRKVKIKTVYARFLDLTYTLGPDGTVTSEANPEADPTQHIEEEFIIDSYVADENTVQFQLDPIIDLSVKIPRRAYTSGSCYWQYKDLETCGYAGALPSCRKTLTDCKTHGNQLRFGGFPGISNSRRVYL